MTKHQNKILAIDVGNTNIHWCFMENGNIQGEYNRNKHTELSMLPWDEIKKQDCPVVIAGALIHMNDAVKVIASDHKVSFVEMDTNKQNIIKDTYPSLGIDRICNLIASLKSLPNLKSPVIVFDFGTATTITSCDQNGNFLGGLITTGCEIELKTMSSKTLSLPHVELAKEQKISKLNLLCKNTEDAILHGAIIAQISLIEYYLNIFKKEVSSNPKLVFTGGNAPTVSRFMDKKCDLNDPHLTIKGIYHCYQSSLIHAS